MRFLAVVLCAIAAVSATTDQDAIDSQLLAEFGVTMTQEEAVAANVNLENLMPDSAVLAELGCSWNGICGGSTVLDVAWKLGARCFVKAALFTGLGGVLKQQNVTAFVPTDRAFAKLPLPLHVFLFFHRDILRDVLQYHLVNGSFPSSKLFDEETIPTRLRNGSFPIRYNIYRHANLNDTKTIQGSPFELFDQNASNGVVHLVRDVILKIADGSLYQRLQRSTGFSSFFNALAIAGLDGTVKGLPLGTIFAPSNEAIARLPAGYWQNLLNDKAKLKTVLQLHIAPNGVWFSRGLRDGDKIPTLNKQNQINVHFHERGPFTVNNVTVIFRDVGANNGIVDGINGLLIPTN